MKLNKLVSAIQKSVVSASELIQKRNLDLLEVYFEKADGTDVKAQLRDALSASISGEGPHKAKELVDKVMDSISSDIVNAYNNSTESLVPKTVTIQYPKMTTKGPDQHMVTVPLIALVPINLIQLSCLTLKTELEVVESGDELEISFPVKTSEQDEPLSSRPGIATLEITIDKSTPPNGLQKLVEGYEKALRAQLPN